MAAVFPNQEWLDGFIKYLNSSEDYARVAKSWEGDMIFDIRASGPLKTNVAIYLDLWHGECRSGKILDLGDPLDASFILTAPFDNFVRVVKGDLDPMQAMLTRKLTVKGNMAVMLRNVPTVLEFVKSAQEVTDKVLGD